MSFFEDILCKLSNHLKPGAQIICGYMIKHQADASFKLLDQYMGATTTSLAQKKARLIFCTFERSPAQSPYPIKVTVESFAKPFVNHANLFSREKLDIGTRFLLEQIPENAEHKTILDLGCGNGIIGIAAKKTNPGAKIIFSDDSYQAIQSAKANFDAYFPDQSQDAQFVWTHCFENQTPNSADAVICNPPFHQGHTVGASVAWQMFKDAHRSLKTGGLLRVIGNQHLNYQHTLKRIFDNSDIIARNQKFTIVDAVK